MNNDYCFKEFIASFKLSSLLFSPSRKIACFSVHFSAMVEQACKMTIPSPMYFLLIDSLQVGQDNTNNKEINSLGGRHFQT